MTFTTVTDTPAPPRNPHAQWLWLLASFALALAIVATGAVWNRTQGIDGLTNGAPGTPRLIRQAELIREGSGGTATAPAPQAVGVTVSLPHQMRESDGVRATYRIRLDTAPQPVGHPPIGVCVFRGYSSASLWLDGRLLTAATPGAPGLRDALHPQFHSLPPDLPAGAHRIDIGVSVPAGLPPALSEVLVGEGARVRMLCNASDDREQARLGSSLALMAMMGLVALAIGWLQRDRAALWFALMCATWIGHHVLLASDWPWIDERLWVLLFFLTRPLIAFPLIFFALRFTGARHTWGPRGVIALFVVGYGAFPWLAPGDRPNWLFVFGAALLCVLAGVLWHLVRFSLRRNGPSGFLLGTALFITLLTNAADMARRAGLLPFGPRQLADYIVPLLSLAIGALLIERLASYMRDAARSSERMREELERQRAQIAEDYATMQEQRDRIAILEERKRIVRDMHDGLGTQLVSASALLNSSETSSGPMRDVIDGALQELRIVLDVLSSPMQSDVEDDLGTLPLLLGKLRHRMEPVLRARGITMRWDVDDLPADFLPRDQDKLQLLRLVQEAFANVIKHAGASQALFTAHRDAERIVIEVADNGRGIDPRVAAEGSETGHGILSMRARAELLGGRLDIEDNAPGTRIRVTFPRRPDADGPPSE